MSNVRYSVIIPTYNGASSITNVLNALARQSIPARDFEIVVVDDASTDTTSEVVTAYASEHSQIKIVYVRRDRNGGPSAARNAGIAAAQGSILFFTDDDCEPAALWMEKHLRVHSAFPEVAGVQGWYAPISGELQNPNVLFVYLFYHFLFSSEMLEAYEGLNPEAYRDASRSSAKNFPATNTANFSIKRWAMTAVKGFDERFSTAGSEDAELGERLRAAGYYLYYIPHTVTHHKQLSFLGLLRMARNRATGRAVYERVVNQRSLSRSSAFSTWRAFLRYWDTDVATGTQTVLGRDIRWRSFLYIMILFSPFSQWYYFKKHSARARKRSS